MTGHHRKKGAQRGTKAPETGKVVRQTVIPTSAELDERCKAYRGREERVWMTVDNFLDKYFSKVRRRQR